MALRCQIQDYMCNRYYERYTVPWVGGAGESQDIKSSVTCDSLTLVGLNARTGSRLTREDILPDFLPFVAEIKEHDKAPRKNYRLLSLYKVSIPVSENKFNGLAVQMRCDEHVHGPCGQAPRHPLPLIFLSICIHRLPSCVLFSLPLSNTQIHPLYNIWTISSYSIILFHISYTLTTLPPNQDECAKLSSTFSSFTSI